MFPKSGPDWLEPPFGTQHVLEPITRQASLRISELLHGALLSSAIVHSCPLPKLCRQNKHVDSIEIIHTLRGLKAIVLGAMKANRSC